MLELCRKYLDNQCSPEEVKELMAHFNNPENEVLLRQLITESLEEIDADDDGSQWIPVTGEAFHLIKSQIKSEPAPVVPIFKTNWFRIAAAAILLAGIVGAFLLVNNTKPKQEIVKRETNNQQEPLPGSNKGQLTLADGSTIALEKLPGGTVALQGSTKIEITADGFLSYKSSNEKPTEVLFNNLVTPRGGKYQLILSDGTKIWLNAESSLSYPSAFAGNERRVKLVGEAYFEVITNASMPFVVDVAGKGEVEVLGTHFNINAYNDESTVNTTLLEGRVKVTASSNRTAQILNPGEQASLNIKGQIQIHKNADTDQAIAWKNGTFNFNNADLDIVLRQLSRWYAVDIVVEGSIPKRQFNGEIQRDLKLSQVLKLLEKNNVVTRLEGDTLFILVL